MPHSKPYLKGILLGRHTLLEAQKEAIASLGVKIIEHCIAIPEEELERKCKRWLRKGAKVVIFMGEALHVLEVIAKYFRLFQLRMKQVGSAQTLEEAYKFVDEDPKRRTFLPGKESEPFRLLVFVGVDEVKLSVKRKVLYRVVNDAEGSRNN